MTTMARRDPADKAKIDAIEKKLLANSDIAKLIDDGPDPRKVDTTGVGPILYKTDHTVLCILVKFSRHFPDFPIYSNRTKPAALHSWCNLVAPDVF
ncbi:hypothetical protein GWO60_07495 [Corynebacterium macginleyi]|nr:hypothetical protein [Corynebacterium macginleyi]